MTGTPRAKNGQLKCQWGKLADSDPDIVISRGEGIPRADAHLLHGAITQRQYSPFSKSWDKSFLEELTARGYDIKTLRISIEKIEK